MFKQINGIKSQMTKRERGEHASSQAKAKLDSEGVDKERQARADKLQILAEKLADAIGEDDREFLKELLRKIG